MNEDQLNFIRTLYGKYGITLDPERESKVLDAFSRDFDGSLSVFYSKYNPQKEVTPDFINTVKSKSGFAQMQNQIAQQTSPSFGGQSFGSDASFGQMIGRTSENVWPQVQTAWLDFAGWLAGGEAKMSQTLGEYSKNEGIAGSAARAAKAFVDWRPFADEGINTNEDWHRELIKKREEYQSKIKETVTLDDVLARKDLSSLAAFAVDGAAGFLASLSVGIPTGGIGFMPMFAGSAYMDALKEKSEVTDQDMIEIVKSGEADWFIPTMVGSIAAALERYGLSKMGGYLSGRLSGKVGKEAIDAASKTIKTNKDKLSSLTGDARKKAISEINDAKKIIEASKSFLGSSAENVTRQSFINWTEYGLHELAKNHARTEDLDAAQKHMADAMFSKEGANAFASAGLGTLLMGGVSKASGSAFRAAVNKPADIENKAQEKKADASNKLDEIILKAEDEAPIVDSSLKNELDSIVNDYKESTLLEESKKEAEKEVEEEAKKLEKNAQKESKAQEAIEDQKLADVAREVKDASSLQRAVYEFFGIDNTNQANVEKVSTISNIIDRIVEARARREGIKKADWYRSRIASIGRVGETGEQKGAMTNFLSDGRAVIMALNAPDARGFFREFGKVIRRDLNEQETAALSEEFGLDFNVVSEESESLFLEAFESYLERGEMPSSIKGARLDLIQRAFAKISEWLKDIKSAIQGQEFYINSNIQNIFDAIVSGTEIKQQDAQAATETAIDTDVQSDTGIAETDKQVGPRAEAAEGEVVDLTEAQEEVTDAVQEQETGELPVQPKARGSKEVEKRAPKAKPKKVTKEKVEDEQKTEKTAGEESKQDAPSVKEDREDTKRPETRVKGQRITTEEQAKSVADKLVDSAPTKNKKTFFSGKLQSSTKKEYSDFIRDAKSLIESGLIGVNRIKSLESEIKRIEKDLAKNEILEKRIEDVAKKAESMKEELKKQGLSPTQVKAFLAKHPDKEILSFEDGDITFSDQSGDIGIYSVKEDKIYEGAKADKRVRERESRAVEKKISEERTQKKTEEEIKASAGRRSATTLAESAYDDAIIKETGTARISMLRFLEKVVDIDISKVNFNSSSFTRDSLSKNITDTILRYLDQRTKGGKLSNMLLGSYRDHEVYNSAKKVNEVKKGFSTLITNILNKDGLLNESQKDAIRAGMVSVNAELERIDALVEVKGTLADKSAGTVTYYGPKTRFVDFIRNIHNKFGLKTRLMIVDGAKYSPKLLASKPEKGAGPIVSEYDRYDKEALKIAKTTIMGMFGHITEEATINDIGEANFDILVSPLYSDLKKLFESSIKGNPEAKRITNYVETTEGEKISFELIFFDSSTGAANSAVTLAHEYGHTIMDELLSRADKKTRAAIDDDFARWKKEKRENIRKIEKERKLKVFDILSFRPAMNASNNIRYISKLLSSRASNVSSDTISNMVYDSIEHVLEFNEYFADQVSQWMVISEQANTVAGRFFQAIAKAIRLIYEQLSYQYNVSTTLNKFLEDQLSGRYKEINQRIESQRNHAKEASVSYMESIENSRRKIIDMLAELESLKGNLKFANKPTPEDLRKAREDRDSRIESLEEAMRWERRKISKYKLDVKSSYAVYKGSGGNVSFATFVRGAKTKAEEKRQRKIEKEVNKAIFDDFGGISEIGDMYSMGANASIGNIDNRLPFLDRIGKVIDGKFSNKKQYNAIIESINKSLTSNGLPKLSKKEALDLFDSTGSGVIAKITFPLLARFTGIGKKKGSARPTERLKRVIDSMHASPKERAEAREEIHRILESYTGTGSLAPSAIPAKMKDIKTYIAKAIKAAPKIKRATEEDLDRIAELELVGIANAPISEMRRVMNEGYVKEVITGERSKIKKAVQENANKLNYQSDRAVIIDVLGAKESSSGVFKADIFANGKPVSFKIFNMNNPFSKGDTVVYLGKIYMAVNEIEKGTPFMEKNFEFRGEVGLRQTRAQVDKKGIADRAKKFINNMFLGSHGIESLVARMAIDSDATFMEGEMNKAIGEDGFRLAGVRARDKALAIEKKFFDIVSNIFDLKNEKDARRKVLEIRTKPVDIKFKDNLGNNQTQTYYISDLMDYFAALRQPDLRKRFDSMAKRNIDPRDTRFWNASKEAAILDALPVEFKTLVERVSSEIMPEIYGFMNKTHNKINGYDIISLANYFPVTTGIKGQKATELDIEAANVSSFLNSVSNKNLKDRSAGGAIQADDYVVKLLNYISRATHYAEYAEPVSLASRMFERNYKGAMEQLFGKEVVEQISWNLNNIAANTAASYQRNAYVDMVRNMSISGAFMANLTMIPKQLSSFAAYANSMPALEWMSYYRYMATNPMRVINDIREILNTNFIKERIAQAGRMNLDTLNLQLDKLEGEINKTDAMKRGEEIYTKIANWMFKPVMWGDIGAIISGGAPYWSYLKKQAESKFPGDKQKQNEWINVKFEESTARTQQSKAMLDSSKWQTSSSVASLFTTFMSTPMLYGRILSGGFRDIARGTEKLKSDRKTAYKLIGEGSKKVVLFGAVLPLLFQSASTGFSLFSSDDDDEKNNPLFISLSYFGISFFQHVPILYPLLQNFIDRTVLDRSFDPSIAAPIAIQENAVLSAQRIVSRLMDDNEIDWSEEAVQKDIDKIAKAVGLNTGMARNLYNAWSDPVAAAQEDILLLMGYSPYALGLQKPGDSRATIK